LQSIKTSPAAFCQKPSSATPQKQGYNAKDTRR